MQRGAKRTKKNATVEHGSGDELVDQICANLAAARVAT
jgi:hypothetical protein